jgi:hypothetical protein
MMKRRQFSFALGFGATALFCLAALAADGKGTKPAAPRQVPEDILGLDAIKRVVVEFPVLQPFRFFANLEEQPPVRNYRIFYVSTNDIAPVPPFYYIAVHRSSRKPWMLNLVDGKDFRGFCAGEGFALKNRAEQERYARLFLKYYITRTDYLDRLTDETLGEVRRKLPGAERGLTFYPRQDGGGRLIFYSYESGGMIRRWDLSLSPKAEILVMRQQEAVAPAK